MQSLVNSSSVKFLKSKHIKIVTVNVPTVENVISKVCRDCRLIFFWNNFLSVEIKTVISDPSVPTFYLQRPFKFLFIYSKIVGYAQDIRTNNELL